MSRIFPLAALFAALALASSAAAATTAPIPRPAKLGLCAACHGEDGRGQDEARPRSWK
jgi:cytochrome c553